MNPRPDWTGGIIAAGQGQRLRAGGWRGSKAMVLVANLPLIDHALDRFATAGVARVTVLINDDGADCRDHIASRSGLPAIDLVVRTTPSSFASFILVANLLAGKPAVVSTVDAIMAHGSLSSFLDTAACLPTGALFLAVTTHVDDEAPLWVDVDSGGRVVALGRVSGTHVTAGLYAWSRSLPRITGIKFGRLREYLGWVVESGYPVFAIELPQVLDVDRPEDIAQAELAIEAWALAGQENRA